MNSPPAARAAIAMRASRRPSPLARACRPPPDSSYKSESYGCAEVRRPGVWCAGAASIHRAGRGGRERVPVPGGTPNRPSRGTRFPWEEPGTWVTDTRSDRRRIALLDAGPYEEVDQRVAEVVLALIPRLVENFRGDARVAAAGFRRGRGPAPPSLWAAAFHAPDLPHKSEPYGCTRRGHDHAQRHIVVGCRQSSRQRGARR